MEALQVLQYHHQQTPPIMTALSSNINLTTLCLHSIISRRCLFTSPLPKLGGKIKATTTRVYADELKENWLNSLTCPPLLMEPDNVEGFGKGEVPLSSQWVIGIDPDVSGAMALLKTDDSGSSVQVYDSPNLKMLVGKRVRRRLDTKAMVRLLRSFNAPIGTIAYIEQSLPYPRDGKQGWWSAGFNYGLWIGVLVASEVSVVPVPSIRWKNEFKLSGNGSTKDDSRALACTLFPSLSSSLQRKKDHGRAEALLIAAYGKGIIDADKH